MQQKNYFKYTKDVQTAMTNAFGKMIFIFYFIIIYKILEDSGLRWTQIDCSLVINILVYNTKC